MIHIVKEHLKLEALSWKLEGNPVIEVTHSASSLRLTAIGTVGQSFQDKAKGGDA
ncbi:hypothetical protein GCM10007160_43830 [Litchfieldella qijiaojingensis]|uniref:Uncharacterized protein n=1 Tax=Litchfieldella qijiaojingensis TaxID=980347 RepID=A0ABQ2ZH50_9GAMM|nr:hypothetical protein GCM10007160_43830 [Halomonas qijiaojingensis]